MPFPHPRGTYSTTSRGIWPLSPLDVCGFSAQLRMVSIASQPAKESLMSQTRDNCASSSCFLSGISSSVCAIEQPTGNWYLRFLCAADVTERRDRMEGSWSRTRDPDCAEWKWMLIAQWRGEARGRLDKPGRPTIDVEGLSGVEWSMTVRGTRGIGGRRER